MNLPAIYGAPQRCTGRPRKYCGDREGVKEPREELHAIANVDPPEGGSHELSCALTRAPLGYFYNAPHWGGAISSPPL